VAGTEDRYEVSGRLGIRGGSYPITLEGVWYELSGGRALVELSGTVSRASIGLTWNSPPILNLLDPIALAIEAELEPVAP
jgi:polyisoprenoid-binding protein YceI